MLKASLDNLIMAVTYIVARLAKGSKIPIIAVNRDRSYDPTYDQKDLPPDAPEAQTKCPHQQ